MVRQTASDTFFFQHPFPTATHELPWLTNAQRNKSNRRTPREQCRLEPKWPVHIHSAWRLQVVDAGPSPADSWLHDIRSDCFPLLHAAQFEPRSTSLRQTSSTVVLPQVAGLLVQRITMCSSHTYRRHPLHQITIMLDVFDDSVVHGLLSWVVTALIQTALGQCRFRPSWLEQVKLVNRCESQTCFSVLCGVVLCRGFTRQPENSKGAHFEGLDASNTTKNFTKGPPREGRKKENCGGRRHFSLRAPPLFHLSGPPPSADSLA